MKKLLLSMACVIGALSAGAAGYTVDFNTAIDTSDLAFKVAPGWKHLVHTGSYTSQKVTYTYLADGGEDGSGGLEAGKQGYYDYIEFKEVILNDLLVSPAVGGKVTLDVKTTEASGNVKFFKVTESDGKLVKGDEITWTGEQPVQMFYTTVTLPAVESGTMIGIRCENAIIDNFTAENVDLQLQKQLTISSSTAATTGKVDCNSDNKFSVGGTVKFKNSGDVDIKSGEEKFSLAMMKKESNDFVVDKIVGTFTINEAIAVGEESSAIEFSALIDESDVTAVDEDKSRRYDIICEIAPASKIFCNVTPIPYKPIPAYSTPISSSLENGGIINVGLVTGSGNTVLTVSNNGAATMNIKSINVSGEGFSCEPNSSITIPKHESKEITISLQSEILGEKNGSLTVNAEDLDPITFTLEGNVLDPDLWYVNFEDGNIPSNMIGEEGWSASSSLAINPNKYYALGSNASKPSKLISPLLKVDAGETISFEAARNYDTSFINVYTSTDRRIWTKIRTLSPEAENEADKLSSEYTGTAWGSNTKYVFTTFKLTDLPTEPFYLAFEAGNARVDNILGGKIIEVDHDIFISPVTAPDYGMVNNEVTVKVKVTNLLPQTESADDYQLALYNGDKMIADLENIDIEGYSAKEFSFVFTPHAEGELTLKIVYTSGEYTTESQEFTITVTEELALQTKQIGKVTDTETSKTAPINLYYKISQSETVYTADLIGLDAGTKITKLVFKGKSGQQKSFDINLKVWLQNTDDATPASVLLDEKDTAQMTPVFDGKYSFNVKKEEPCDLLVIELSDPFVYEGKNLRVAMDHNSNGWLTSYFELDKNVTGQSIVRANDSNLETFSGCALPVMYVDATNDPAVLKGHVSDNKGESIKNALVKIESGNVQYSATTDEDGNYSMKVFQQTLEFSLTVTAEGYKTVSSDLLLEDPETVKDFILEDAETDGVRFIGKDSDDSYYDLNGLRLTQKPRKGLYIYQGKVYVAE